MKRFLCNVAILLVVLGMSNICNALTPDEIIKLKEAGLSEETIRELIRQEGTKSASNIEQPQTQESQPKCPDCHGTGYVSCYVCNGTGGFECSKCEGKGSFTCVGCRGKGYMQVWDSYWKRYENGPACLICDTKGHKICSECNGIGEEICKECNSSGRNICTTCSGGSYSEITIPSSQGIGYLEITITRENTRDSFWNSGYYAPSAVTLFIDDKEIERIMGRGQVRIFKFSRLSLPAGFHEMTLKYYYSGTDSTRTDEIMRVSIQQDKTTIINHDRYNNERFYERQRNIFRTLKEFGGHSTVR